MRSNFPVPTTHTAGLLIGQHEQRVHVFGRLISGQAPERPHPALPDLLIACYGILSIANHSYQAASQFICVGILLM